MGDLVMFLSYLVALLGPIDTNMFHSHKCPQTPSIRNTDRPWRPQPGTPQVVADYLVKAGLTEKMPKDQSTAYMRRRFDRAAVTESRSRAAGGSLANVWRAERGAACLLRFP